MAKSKAWDSTLKRLVRADPAAFVQWLLPGATFIREPVQAETQATEVEVIAFTLAAFALERKNKTVDLEWLIRKFREMHDTLEDSPIYKEILREGLEKGLEKGMGQGRLDATRHILLILTEKRFPTLASLAQEQAALVDDVEVLNGIIVNIGSAQTEREAYTALRGQDKLLAE